MTEEVEKVNHNTIMYFLNAPLMASFGGTNENIVKFIISRYHNGKFYFDTLVEISAETIYKITGLSNKGDPVLVGIKEVLVERITGALIGKNSKGLIIGQVQSTTPKIVAKIMSTSLSITGRDCDLKIDILEVVDYIART